MMTTRVRFMYSVSKPCSCKDNGGDGQNIDPQSMDSPNELPLKRTTPKNNILNEHNLKL